jgi:hypothetical protein
MQRIQSAGVCLAGMLVVCAIVAAGGASAFPERGTCKAAKKGAGEYLNATCTEPGEKGGAKKEFVWVPQAKATAFTSTTGEATLKSYTPEGAELPPVTCTKSKGKGKALTSTTSESVVTFEGCSSAGEKCTGGAKAKAGEIITKTLEGVLGTISGGSGVGERVGGVGGGISAEFKCGANEIETEGSAIGEVSPVNAKAAATSTLTFAVSGQNQAFEELSGKHYNLQTEIDGLGAGTFPFKSTEDTTATVKGTAYEVKGGGGAAAALHFKSKAGYPLNVVGKNENAKKETQTHTFLINESAAVKERVKCEEAEFTGQLAAEATSLLVTPSYKNCKFFPEAGAAVAATVETAGPCGYNIGDLKKAGANVEGTLEPVAIAPAKKCVIRFKWVLAGPGPQNCQMEFEDQAKLSRVVMANVEPVAGKPELEVFLELKQLKDHSGCEGKLVGHPGQVGGIIWIPNMAVE